MSPAISAPPDTKKSVVLRADAENTVDEMLEALELVCVDQLHGGPGVEPVAGDVLVFADLPRWGRFDPAEV